jgi:hypothetical protein
MRLASALLRCILVGMVLGLGPAAPPAKDTMVKDRAD